MRKLSPYVVSQFSSSADRLKLLFLFLIRIARFPLLECAPAIDALVPRLLPVLFVLALALALLQLLVRLPLLATFLLHLRFQLSAPSLLVLDQHELGLVLPLLLELGRLELRAVDRPLVLADQKHACVCDRFVQRLSVLLVHQLRLCFFEAIERLGGERVFGLVGMDQEGLFAVADLDVGFGHAWLEAEDCIGVEPEGFEDTVYFGILFGFKLLAMFRSWS